MLGLNKIKKEKTMKKLNIIGGMQYQKRQTEQVKTEAATIVKNVKVEVSKQ